MHYKTKTTQSPHKQWEVHKTINKQQNHRLRTEAAEATVGLKCILLAPILRCC